MIADAGEIDDGATLDTDLCIIGSGPAGLTLAHRFAGTGAHVVVLERGGLGPAPEEPDVELHSPHFFLPRESLHRQVGGLVPTWNSAMLDGRTPAARYVPLTTLDFEERYWVPNSGWPFDEGQLAPYSRAAMAVCGVAPFDGAGPTSDRPTLPDADGLLTKFDVLAPASAFSEELVGALRRATNVRLLTRATATNVVHGAIGEDRSAVEVRSEPQRGFTVAARLVVLACGAVENARLLLASNTECTTGLGNLHDNVGRYFMDHPRIDLGRGPLLRSDVDMTAYEPHRAGTHSLFGKLSLDPAILRRERILGGNARISPVSLDIASIKSIRMGREAVGLLRRRQLGPGVSRAVTASRHAVPVGVFAFNARYRPRPSLASPGEERWSGILARSFRVAYQPEQAPVRANRVMLGEGTDELGQPVAAVRWQWSDLDLVSIRTARAQFSRLLEQAGVGPITDYDEGLYPASELRGVPLSAHHHLGTTRMSDVAKHGVVDRDGQLHGWPRVFVAGGSVFPTGGYANPTLTIVALALRLADEIERRLGRHAPSGPQDGAQSPGGAPA